MLPPQLSASHRPFSPYPSKLTLRVLRQAPQLSAFVLISTPLQVQNLVPQQRRGCFFGRYSAWSSYLDPNFQRRLERRRKALKHRYVEALHRKSLWEREPNRPSWAWKLSNSWGVPSREGSQVNSRVGGRWVSSDGGTPRGTKGDPGGREDNETRRERLERRMEEIRRLVDEDPFKALFGYRMRIRGRSFSGGAHEDLNSLLNWGRKSCADIVSRLNAHGKGGRDGMEGRTGDTGNKLDVEGKDQAKSVWDDPVQIKLGKYNPQATVTDEFEFDPITMRRVPKQVKVDLNAVDSTLGFHEQSVENFEKSSDGCRAQSPTLSSTAFQEDSVETKLPNCTPASTDKAHGQSNFTPPTEQSQDPMDAELSKYRAKYSWLEREGFVDGTTTIKDHLHSLGPVDAEVSSPAPAQIPKVRDFGIPPEPPSEDLLAATKPSQLRYDSSEPQVEDLDHLRPSDVRASAGILKDQDVRAKEKRQQGRDQLEEEFREIGGRETTCAEEVEAMKVLQKSDGVKDRHETMPENDGFDAVPQVQETIYVQDGVVKNTATEGGKGGVHDQTPQRAETCYDREARVERTFLHEAEAGGHGKIPQGREASYAQEVEGQKQAEGKRDGYGGEPRRLQTSLDRQVKAQEASASVPESDIYGYESNPAALEKSYTREIERQKVQEGESNRPEPWDELSEDGRQRASSSELDRALDSELALREYDEFIPPVANNPVQIVGAESSREPEHSVWGNRNPKSVAAQKSKRQHDGYLVKEIKGINEDAYGAIDTDHRMQPRRTKGSDEEGPDVTVDDALTEHDRMLGPTAYEYGGDYGLEAEILAKSQPQTSDESKTHEHHGPEELAMRREEQEQILHEVKEVNDFLHDVQSEFDAIKTKTSTRADSHPVIYKILAFDPSTNELKSGITSSSTDSEILSPSEVIPRLTHPAKFLPSLTALKKEGYEIVSGGKNVLVFKRVHEGPFIEEEDPIPDEYPQLPSSSLYPYVNPIDGTTTGNFASPTGFVNHDAIFSSPFSDTDAQPPHEPPPAPLPAAARSPISPPTDKVKREEAVFSGQRKWQDTTSSASESAEPGKGRVKKAAKRVFWVGLWVAGCSYAVGVMGEYFRTGGVDGAGPPWFSGFH